MKKSLFFRIVRGLVDLFYPKIELVGLEGLPKEPCVLVGNHSQMHGPIISEVRLPFDHYTWCTHEMMEKEEVAEYAFADFWADKPRTVRPLFYLFSRIIPVPAANLLSNARTIPVYRDMRCISTFRTSIDRLIEGSSMVIFPECREPHDHIVNAFQSRFVDMARFYSRKAGRELSFVPMYIAPNLRKVFFGTPVVFDSTQPIEEERERICDALMEEITRIAVEQPVHVVVPYENKPKKQYPKNHL